MQTPRLLLLGGAVVILGLTATVATLWVHESAGNRKHTLALQQALQSVAAPRQPVFELIDRRGRPVTQSTWRG